MEKQEHSTLKGLYELFLNYKHVQIYFTQGNGCCFSFVVKSNDMCFRSSPICEVIIQSGLNCIILKEHFSSPKGDTIKQEVDFTYSVCGRECNADVVIGTLKFSAHLF